MDQKTVASNVLNYFDTTKGYPAGSFTEAVIRVACLADRENLARLSQGFPEIGEAVDLAKNNPNGIAILESRL